MNIFRRTIDLIATFLSDFPAPPFQAKILSGAKAYSSPGGRVWGNVTPGEYTVGSVWSGHARIDNPLWSNGKPFWVETKYVELITVEPEPPPPPTGDIDDFYVPAGQDVMHPVDSAGNPLGEYVNENELHYRRQNGA